MSATKATQAFVFRENGKAKLYEKGEELQGAALAHAQAHGFALAPQKKTTTDKPAAPAAGQ